MQHFRYNFNFATFSMTNLLKSLVYVKTVPRCDGEIATKTREVGELGDEIQLLQASIESSEAAVSGHEEKLESVAMDMAKWSAQKEILGLLKANKNGFAMKRWEIFTYDRERKTPQDKVQGDIKSETRNRGWSSKGVKRFQHVFVMPL